MDADPIVLDPGSPEWLREMTASKVAAVLGLSPWQSRFSLWYEMAGAVPHADPTRVMERGHYLEPAVAAWVGDQYRLNMLPGQCWRSRARPWQVASPDRLAVTRNGRLRLKPQDAVAVVEVKTAAKLPDDSLEEWGRDGTDEIPPYYRAQVVWQCDTLGLPRGYVGVLLPYLEFRGYVIEPAPGEAAYIREECRAFLDTLATGDPPDVDRHSATYRTVRALNPDLTDEEVPVTWEQAHAYARAHRDAKAAAAALSHQQAAMGQLMGSAKRAVCAERTVAVRQRGPSGLPYVGVTRSKSTAAHFADNPEPPDLEDPDV